jgi:hypothetical protein
MIVHKGAKLATFYHSLIALSSMYLLPNGFEFVELEDLSLLEIPSNHG